jgi:hypothetical protein
MFGYIDVNLCKVLSPRVWHIPPEAFCVQRRVTGCKGFGLCYGVMLLLRRSGDRDSFFFNNGWFCLCI